MKSSFFSNPMTLWAVRDLMRRPFENGFTLLALTLLVMIAGTVLLLSQSLSGTVQGILAEGPDLVIRRLAPGGWMPLPIEPTLAAIESVPGVINPRPRIWGSVRAATRYLTVIGVDEKMKNFLVDAGITPPLRGEAVTGAAAAADSSGQELLLSGDKTVALSIAAVLPKAWDMVAHDVVWAHPDDAREILGLPEGHATDMALDVFHDAEAALLVPDLLAALPWQAQVSLQKDARGAIAGNFARLGGLGLMVSLPALLALLLLVVVTVRSQTGGIADMGLLKAMGWRTRDIVRLHTTQSLLVALPGTGLGLAGAYVLVFWPGLNWIPFLFFGWRETAPPLFLSAQGAGMVLVQLGAGVLMPYAIAAWWSAYRAASADPADLVRGGRWL